MRLIDHLKELGLTGGNAKRALQSGKVWVAGVPTALAIREVKPDQVEIRTSAARIRVGRDPVLLHVTDGFVVVWKPAGMLSVPAPGREQDKSVLTEVGRILGRTLAVHRLDEGTSGLMLVARNAETQEAIKDQLERHEVERRYLALISPSVVKGWQDTIESTLIRDRGDGKRGSGPGGKRAVTHFSWADAAGSAVSLVRAQLETGRTHQVRIHAAEAGHAVLGDRLYGSRKIAEMSPRLALHAWRLSFTDPGDGTQRRFEAPLADDLESLLRRLQRPNKPD